MKKTKIKENDFCEQIAFDLEDNISPEAEFEEKNNKSDAELKEESTEKAFKIGAKVMVNPEIRCFCDGKGIPDCAREAYIKYLNLNNKTIVIESKPFGKEYGLLLMSQVTLI